MVGSLFLHYLVILVEPLIYQKVLYSRLSFQRHARRRRSSYTCWEIGLPPFACSGKILIFTPIVYSKRVYISPEAVVL